MDTLVNDLRYAIRRLLRSPGFTIAAALTLALGIGATTTIFTLLNAILLRPPAAITAPDRLVSLYTSDFSGPPYGTSSIPDYEDFRAQTDVFAGVLYFMSRPAAVGRDETAERVGVEVVSENFFTVLGVRPAHGRFFTVEEGRPGAPPVAVIGDALFRGRFNGDPSVVGTSIELNGRPFTVVGVAPPGFAGASRPLAHDVWLPVHGAGEIGGVTGSPRRDDRGIHVMARLAPGVTIETARARMGGLARQLFAAHPADWTDVSRQGRRISVVSERDSRIPPDAHGPALGMTALLMTTVGIVLLVCCANVASLMLARSASRGREIAVRTSLGASRGRLVRQLLTESAVVALVGGGLGVLMAAWTTGAMFSLLPPIPVSLGVDLSVDGRVVAFAVLVSLATGIVFGLAPALRVTRPDLASAIRSDSPMIDLGGRRLTLQNVLVVTQVAMSVILLVGAGLFVRALRQAAAVNPGFRVENLLIAPAQTRPGIDYPGDPGALMLELQQRLAALPGVRSVSWAGALPLEFEASRRTTRVEGYTRREGEDTEFHFYNVGPRYFETMEIPLVAGREFTAADRAGSAGVIVVNEAFARRFWPGADPLGKRVSVRGPTGPYLEVIGVSRSGRFRSLAEESPPMFFLPALQDPTGSRVLVRTTGEPLGVLPAVRREVESLAPGWTVERAGTMEQHIAASVLPQRIAGTVLTIFGIAAVILVAVGVYGVVAYAVATRTREIGLRVALGARPNDVRRFVIARGARLVGLGVIIALPVAAGLGRLLSGFLVGGNASDPIAFAGAIAVLGVVALTATYLPARRATAVDPMVALRNE